MRHRAGQGVKQSFMANLINSTIKSLTGLVSRIDDAELAYLPERGPLIIVSNHINFFEVPAILTRILPREATGFAKAETWDNPIFAYVANLWGAIPLRRGEADMRALKLALEALDRGFIVGIAPEGTRSGDGRLLRGISGVVVLALKSGAPLLPIVHYGAEKLWKNLRRLRRTDFHVRVGSPFYLRSGEERVSREVRQEMVDEIMYQIAALLPPAYRGYYGSIEMATERYLHFPPGSQSNLLRVSDSRHPNTSPEMP
ncbi:MAG: 1-acyl-sn-glycerol-3-phosphate acyltransferase [Anaerolineales bacterium]|nr:1-acyl-sn-glycerol-3-phosphate acyltransferase [Anaerolineales bacterium]